MYEGFWAFNGDEIINHARTAAYLDNGYVPPGVQANVGEDVSAVLLDVLHDGRPYGSPVADGAPWVESGNPDTYDFAGVVALDITGASGSTRTATTTEFGGNGGSVSTPRFGTRTIAVTALLIGRTGASAEAGLSWLSQVLDGSNCTNCLGDELCAYSAVPDGYEETPAIDADPITEVLNRAVDGWTVTTGRFWSTEGRFDPEASSPGGVARYGTARYGFTVYGVGGPVYSDATYGESVFGLDDGLPTPVLSAPEQTCYQGEVAWAWNLSTVKGAVSVSYGAKDPATGAVLARTSSETIQGDAPLVFNPDPLWESWVPVLWVEGNPVLIHPTITHTPYLTAEQCADTYQRSYLDVTTVDGPKVIEKVPFACGEYALKVEWTWVVGNPFIFGSTTPLVTGFDTATATATAMEAGVRADTEPLVMTLADDPACVTDDAPVTLGVVDPCNPGFLTPPRPPVIADLAYAPPNSWRRYSFTVPARLATANDDGLLGLSITNDDRPKRGVRLRLYADPLERGLAGIDECNFCAEFTLTYVPPNSVLSIDAARRRVTTTLPGSIAINTSASVRGAAGGPFDYPSLQCNVAHLVILDVPDDYDRACSPYAVGETQGDLRFDLSLTTASI
jgi:hypothetical protein